MKNTLRLSIAAMAAIATLGACRPGPSGSPYHITATAGSMGSFTSTGAAVTNNGAAGAKITIQGTTTTGARFLIALNPYAGTTGTFPLAYGTNTICQYNSSGMSPALLSIHGTVTLTSVSPDLVGTFAFTGQDSSVNTGSFHVPPPTP